MLNWEKCYFMVKERIKLDHKISKKVINFYKVDIKVIKKLPPPVFMKGIQTFLRYARFYHRFIKYLSKIAHLL